jgi:hypothetical protein
MGVSHQQALDHLKAKAEELYRQDPSVRSVSIAQEEDGTFSYFVTRSSPNQVFAFAPKREAIDDIPIIYSDSNAETTLLRNFSPLAHGSLEPEQQTLRNPLFCGMQLQNYDQDIRLGRLPSTSMGVGTLGCFVRKGNDLTLLSANHVLAGENDGRRTTDRILQPGTVGLPAYGDQIATLIDFVPLSFSLPQQIFPKSWNQVDAAVATLVPGSLHQQAFHSSRNLPPLAGTGTTAWSHRTDSIVKGISAIVGPVPYSGGKEAWFENSIVIQSASFATFGDSGAVVVRQSDHRILGLVYAGDGTHFYACPIDVALQKLGCTLA